MTARRRPQKRPVGQHPGRARIGMAVGVGGDLGPEGGHPAAPGVDAGGGLGGEDRAQDGLASLGRRPGRHLTGPRPGVLAGHPILQPLPPCAGVGAQARTAASTVAAETPASDGAASMTSAASWPSSHGCSPGTRGGRPAEAVPQVVLDLQDLRAAGLVQARHPHPLLGGQPEEDRLRVEVQPGQRGPDQRQVEPSQLGGDRERPVDPVIAQPADEAAFDVGVAEGGQQFGRVQGGVAQRPFRVGGQVEGFTRSPADALARTAGTIASGTSRKAR